MGSGLTFGEGHPLPKLHHGKLQTESCPIEVAQCRRQRSVFRVRSI